MVDNYVIGLDVSYTSTGVAVFRNEIFLPDRSFVYGTKPTAGTSIFRAKLTALKVCDFLRTLDGEVNVFIEDYAFARLTNREKMGELGGIVKLKLMEEEIKYETLPISTIRKVVTGKGNAAKDLVMLSLLSRHGLTISQNDLADATAVALTGMFITKARNDKNVINTWNKEIQDAVKNYLKGNP